MKEITREQIRLYAEASGDFNRIHLDSDFAKAAGFPDVIAHGMLSMGLVGQALEQRGIGIEKMKSFQMKFKDVVLVGDSLEFEISEEASKIQVVVKTDSGREVGTAQIELNGDRL